MSFRDDLEELLSDSDWLVLVAYLNKNQSLIPTILKQ